MVIDIDSFLNKYDSKEEDKSLATSRVAISLDFQKDVEDKLKDVEKKGVSGDFLLLKKIYDEVKRFDEDLPNKFLGIDSYGNNSLKVLGNKYSSDFYEKVNQNMTILKKQIEEHLVNIDALLKVSDYSSLVKEFDLLVKKYNSFPKEFLKEKTMISSEIRKREAIFNKSIQGYRSIKIDQIRKELTLLSSNLLKSMVPGNILEIESNIESLHMQLSLIPKLFLTELIDEKVKISSLLVKAQKFLENEYIKDFAEREIRINMLISRFHSEYMKNDLEHVLMTYDEILYQFEKLPEVMLSEKIKVYTKINDLFVLINKLIIKNNVSTFMQTYNSSKVIEEATDYLRHIKEGARVNVALLAQVRGELMSLPEVFIFEAKSLVSQIDLILNKTNSLKNKSKELEKNSSKDATIISKVAAGSGFDIDKPIFDDMSVKENDEILKKSFNDNIFSEINLHLQKLKSVKDDREFEILYKNILVLVNSLNVSESVLREMKNKLELIYKKRESMKKGILEKKSLEDKKEVNSSVVSHIYDVKTQGSKEKKDLPLVHRSYNNDVQFGKNIEDEINLHIKRLKESNDKDELKILYKKTMFYIDSMPIEQKKKLLMTESVNHIIAGKKFV